MPTLTNPYSFQFNGLTFGGTGSPYQILSVDGLEALPGLRVQDDNRGFNDGMFSGRDFLAGRTISIIFNTFGSGGNSAQTNYNTLQRALLPQTSGTTPLYFYLPPNTTQVINARVRALRTTVTPEYTYGFITSQIEFFCPNPAYFDEAVQTVVMSGTTSAQGRIYDRTYDLVYTGVVVYLSGIVNNQGWATTYPTITINGPITDPQIINTTTGDSLQLAGAYTLSTDVITIDLYNKLIYSNGVPARNILVGGNWFGAISGINEFALYGTGVTAGVTGASITYQSAYI